MPRIRFKLLISICFVIFSTALIQAENLFSEGGWKFVGSEPLDIKAGHLNSDSFIDLAVTSASTTNITILFNNGDWTFSTLPVSARYRSNVLSIVDISGDGLNDVVVGSSDFWLQLYIENTSNGSFLPPQIFGGGCLTALELTDVDNDNDIDVISTDGCSYGLLVRKNLGGYLSESDYISSYPGPSPVDFVIVEMDNNGTKDFVVANNDDFGLVAVLMGQPDGNLLPPHFAFSSPGRHTAISAADFDRDGDQDIAMCNEDDPVVEIWRNRGDGFPLQWEPYYFEYRDAKDLVAADFDGINGVDLAIVHGDFLPAISIELNNGDGTFPFSYFENNYDIEGPAESVAAADFDCDGDIDLIFPIVDINRIYWLVNNSAMEKASILPQVVYSAMAHTINPTTGFLILENFTNGHRAADVDTLTLRINETIELSSFLVLYPDYGPCDKFIRAEFYLQEFLAEYGVLWDSTIQIFTVTGQYSDGKEFSVEGNVTMIGHRSGDLNRDGGVTISDLSVLVNFVFRGGREPLPVGAGDIDGKCGAANVSDLNYFVNFLFRNGPAPTHICAN